MGFQCFDYRLSQRQCAAPAPALRINKFEARTNALKRAMNRKRTGIEAEVFPLKRKQLTTAKPAKQREQIGWLGRIALHSGK